MPVEPNARDAVLRAVEASRDDLVALTSELIRMPPVNPRGDAYEPCTRIGGIADCVAYGPGVLEVSHQPDEWVAIDDLVHATQVIALAVLDLAGTA